VGGGVGHVLLEMRKDDHAFVEGTQRGVCAQLEDETFGRDLEEICQFLIRVPSSARCATCREGERQEGGEPRNTVARRAQNVEG